MTLTSLDLRCVHQGSWFQIPKSAERTHSPDALWQLVECQRKRAGGSCSEYQVEIGEQVHVTEAASGYN